MTAALPVPPVDTATRRAARSTATVFVLAGVAKLSVERTTVAILPWLVPLLLALIAITYIPELTLWLPKYMGLSK